MSAAVEHLFGTPDDAALARVREAGDVWMMCEDLDVDVEPDQTLVIFHRSFVVGGGCVRCTRCDRTGHTIA